MAVAHRVAAVADIPDEGCVRVIVNDTPIAIVKSDGVIYAVSDTCTHDEASLCDGDVFNGIIECPLHGARFELATGKVRAFPAVIPLQTYPVTIDGGHVLVTLPD
ncbi:MAG: non-heme iron oxygenase ferredoxin subunit [Dehalococcoidia bacterium]|nr:non-heme iron oxygenase ferredoxin subunit [Dehalococcoidia bacterium]